MPIGQPDVDRVLKVMRDTGLLPMPGGHGVWPILPPGVCSSYAAMFPFELRAMSLVWMLADARLRWRDFRTEAMDWLSSVEHTPGEAVTRNPLDDVWRGGIALVVEPALPWSVLLRLPGVSLRLLDAMYARVEPSLTKESDKKRLKEMRQGAKDSLKTIVIEAAEKMVKPLFPKANEGWATYSQRIGLNKLDTGGLSLATQRLEVEPPAFPAPPGNHSALAVLYGLTGDHLLDTVRLLAGNQEPHGGYSGYHWKLFNRACLAALDRWLAGMPGIPRNLRSVYGFSAIAALPGGQHPGLEILLTSAWGRLLRLLPGYIVEEGLREGASGGLMPIREACVKSEKMLLPGDLAEDRPEGIPEDGDVRVAFDVLAYFHANRFDRWTAKAWRDAALQWFARHAPKSDNLASRDKCEAMLEALVQAGKPEADAADCARERIAELSMVAKPLPAALRQGAGNIAWQLTEPQRDDLNGALRQEHEGSRLRARLLIRLLLTRLGMAAHLNKKPTGPAKSALYGPLRLLLANCVPEGAVAGEAGCTPAAPSCPALRQAIGHAPGLVRGIDLIVADIQEWNGSPGGAPPLFALYDGTELPDMRALALEVDPDLRSGIEAVDLAADLVLDVLLDPMHAGQAHYFGDRQYNYFAGAIRGKESLHNYFAHLAQDPCSTRVVVQACVPPAHAPSPSRCPLCRCQ